MRKDPGHRDIDRVISDYCAAWAETNPAKREARLRSVVTDDVFYADPSVSVVGVGQLSQHIEGVIARYPKSTIVVTSVVDLHHGALRFGWKKVLHDGTSLPEGVDFCELSTDGKLGRIVGFFGPMKPAKEPRGVVLTIFRARLNPEVTEEYGTWAARMSALAKSMPGYISHKGFVADDGERVTIVEFESLEAQRAWSLHPEHVEAKKRGRDAFYLEYRVQVCSVERDRPFRARQ